MDDSYCAPAATGWARTPAGRVQLLVAGVFVALHAIVPLFVVELYPFSRAPMFSDAPQFYCDYRVTDPEDEEIPLARLGLQRNYWGNPLGVGTGFLPPPTVDRFGHLTADEALKSWVVNRLKEYPELPYVRVQMSVIKAVDDRHIGTSEMRLIRIDNPAHGGGGKP